MNATYPTLNLLPISSNNAQDLLIAMNAGICAGAVMTSTEWDFTRNTVKANPSCSLVQTHDVIRVLSGNTIFCLSLFDPLSCSVIRFHCFLLCFFLLSFFLSF